MPKYQNVANVGDWIRAFDFKDCPDCYVEGKVHHIDMTGEQGFKCFVIIVDKEVWNNPPSDPTIPGLFRTRSRIGDTLHVPMWLSSDWEGRIVKLS